MMEPIEADEGATEYEERQVDLSSTRVADGEFAKAGQPTERALNHPAIAPEAFVCLNAAEPTRLATAAVIVGFIRVQFSRASAWAPCAAAHRRHGIEPQRQHQ